jgi:hypothetical protein
MNLEKLIAEKNALMRGTVRPARVVEVVPDSRGGYRRRELDPAAVQARFRKEWVAAVRTKLGLSQGKFATLLGISKRTVQEPKVTCRSEFAARTVFVPGEIRKSSLDRQNEVGWPLI